MKFCCMNFRVIDGQNTKYLCEERTGCRIIQYSPKWREYNTVHGKGIGYDIYYCPWCGKQLPESLSDKWWDILEHEYGFEDPIDEDRDKVPAEFWTDEWWKKRGL